MAVILGTYPFRGIAQAIRLMLAEVGLEYQERFEDYWVDEEDDPYGNPYEEGGGMPYYMDGDLRLRDYESIITHIALKYDLDGFNEFEIGRIKIAEEDAREMRRNWDKLAYGPINKFDDGKVIYKERLDEKLKKLNDFMDEEIWFAGLSLTYVDFILFELLDINQVLFPDCLEPYEYLKDFKGRFVNLLRVSNYMRVNQFVRRPLNGPTACFGTS